LDDGEIGGMRRAARGRTGAVAVVEAAQLGRSRIQVEHGGRELHEVVVDGYNSELRDGERFVGYCRSPLIRASPSPLACVGSAQHAALMMSSMKAA
jgi:hypothetical protein